MKICVFGAGAIGGYMGAKLAQAGAEVSLVARGPHLAAMKDDGLTLIEDGGGRVPLDLASPARAGEDDAGSDNAVDHSGGDIEGIASGVTEAKGGRRKLDFERAASTPGDSA